MIDVLVFIFLGVVVGLLTGLIPGIHPNLVAILAPIFFTSHDPTTALAFLISLGITNSITSFIPTIFLGAPDPDDALAILPGHKLLMKGMGYYALKLTVIGGLGSLLFIFLISLPLFILLPRIYYLIKPFIVLILILIVSYLILTEREKLRAVAIFLLSGILGILSLRLPVNNNILLFPILTGLFGLPMMIDVMRKDVDLPPQTRKERFLSRKTINKNVLLGSIAGLMTGILPGIGATQATVISRVGERSDEGFLISIGAVTTSNILLSILAIWLIGKPRSGVAYAISNLVHNKPDLLMIIFISLVAGSISSILTLEVSKYILSSIQKVKYKTVSAGVVLFLIIFTLILMGPVGLLLLATATSLGMFAILSNVRRLHLMGVLILPTILFFLGVL